MILFMYINIIQNSDDTDFYCRMCVTKKLFVYDKTNKLYKCPECGSLFKHNKPSSKPKIGIDRELDNLDQTKIVFYKPESKRERILPEVDGNIEVKYEREINRS